MRIAFLTPEYVTEPTFYGGLAQFLGRVTPMFIRRGHQVEVFVSSEKPGRIEHEGVLVHHVPRRKPWLDYPLGVASRLRVLRLGGTRSILSEACGLDRSLRLRAREVHFDLVQASSYFAVAYYAVRRPVAPVVIRVSSYEPMLLEVQGLPMTLDKRLWCRLERKAMERAAAVFAPSRFLAGEIRRRTGIEVHVVAVPFYPREGVEDKSALQSLADWPTYLLYFGKMCLYKGSGILAEAVGPLLERLPDLRVALVGAAPADDAGRRLVELSKSRPDRVRYLGLLKHAQIVPLIRRSRAVVLPSLVENRPNACLEAMGEKAVVVGPDGVSFDELIEDGKSGILFKLGDADALREAIVRAWGLPQEERRRMGEAAKARLTLVTPAQALLNLENFYASVISAYEKPP